MTERRSKKNVTTCEVAFFFIGGIFILAGMAMAVSRFAQKYARWAMEDQLVLSPNSSVIDAWINPVVSTYMNFYVFNVTNADAFINGEKPILEEHGPYVYRMLSPRFDIQFYENDTVSFRNNNTLHFDPSRSVGSEEDILYHINLPLITTNQLLGHAKKTIVSSFLEKINVYENVIKMLGKEDLIVPHTAKEIIFGYEDPMFKAASLFGKNINPYFAPFRDFNNSDDGLFLVKTGRGNFSNFLRIERWNGEEYLPYWSTKYANMINGTDGSFLKPNLTNHETRYCYFPQMRRSLELTYEKDLIVKGINTHRYHFADDLLASASEQPNNIGFCVPEDNCFDSGLLNVGNYGEKTAPIFLSLPHFYQGSEKLQDGVIGLKPNKSLHDSFFYVEPMTGAVLDGQRRLQINTHVTQSNIFAQLGKIQPVFFPYLWIDGSSTVNDDIAAKMRIGITGIAICSYIGYIVIVLGVLMLSVTLLRRYRRRKTTSAMDEQPLVTEVDVDAD